MGGRSPVFSVGSLDFEGWMPNDPGKMDVKMNPLHIASRRLDAFGDSVCLRDPRGRSQAPALREASLGDGRGWLLEGPCAILQRYTVTPQQGLAFVETTRDDNPIHTEDSVVSGAMIAARILLLPELLVPSLAVRSVRIKFRAFCRYGLPTMNRYTLRPDGAGGLDVNFASFQGGSIVADGCLKTIGSGTSGAKPVGVKPAAALSSALLEARCESTETVRRWLRSLNLCPTRTFEAIGRGYPRAFLASLPSGEMVRHGGAGGLLNVLDLEFPEAGVPDILLHSPPTVELESSRPRNAFRRVLTKVASGMVTYCRGYATVLLAMLSRDRGFLDKGARLALPPESLPGTAAKA